jgi:DNA-binding response OmpR family regulator
VVAVHIIVVESDPPALRLLAWGLREEGYEVDLCLLDNAVGCVRDATPAPVAAIVNLIIDDVAKRACVASLRAAASALRIIDLCAHEGDGCGADAHIQAPWRLSDIIAAIKLP